MSLSSPQLIVTALLLPLVAIWFTLVNRIVPDPYLDEVFHVKQALTYWRGQWTTWDPKITTPPILYIYSWILNSIASLLPIKFELDAKVLRLGNALSLLCLLPWDVLKLLKYIRPTSSGDQTNALDIHTTLNICLFPVIFFFSGLYYTDLISVHLVLHTYCRSFSSRSEQKSWVPMVLLCLDGIASLGARQTNIFWTAVFLGGLELIQSFPRIATEKKIGIVEVMKRAWEDGLVHDLNLVDSGVEGKFNRRKLDSKADSIDVFFFVISVGIATIRDIPRVLTRLAPYIFLLVAFGIFVLWNGGVVLGTSQYLYPSQQMLTLTR